jgi:putative acetyltransferase
LERASLEAGEGELVETIRNEIEADVVEIRAVHSACFPIAAESRLVDLLRSAGRLSVSLVAEERGRIIGHVAFSPVTAGSGDAGAGLAPIAVIEPERDRGVGMRLVRAGLDACREAGFGWVVVLGEPEYYGRFGFRPASEFGLSDEYGGGGAFQALELVHGSLPSAAGLVRYAPEFASLE